MRGSTAWPIAAGVRKFTRITHSIVSVSRRVVWRRIGTPALLTSASRPPNASHASSATRTAASVSARSHTHIFALGPQSACTSRSRSARRATIPTVYPCAASIRARAAPMPDDAPVTSTFMRASGLSDETLPQRRALGVALARAQRGEVADVEQPEWEASADKRDGVAERKGEDGRLGCVRSEQIEHGGLLGAEPGGSDRQGRDHENDRR